MYAYIKGILQEISPGKIIIENNGIGYNVLVPANVISSLPPVGGQLKIYTFLHVKEDTFALFGFLSKDDLDIFALLLSVNGVGPKGALAVLSVMTTSELRFAILAGDAKVIAKAPGIGVKMAQRMILELKDKLNLSGAFENGGDAVAPQPLAGGQDARDEAVQALTALGYSSSEAFAAVSKVEITPDTDVEAILKAALKQMAFL